MFENYTEHFSWTTGVGLGLLAFIIIWVVLGIIAFIYSLICFGKSGSGLEKVVGLVLAIFFGPLYWIYYIAVKNYCK